MCLIDALRRLGVKVGYKSHGPFWAKKDGNKFLQPHGKNLVEINAEDATRVGKYVVHLGDRDHFIAVRVHNECVDVMDKYGEWEFSRMQAFPNKWQWFKLVDDNCAGNVVSVVNLQSQIKATAIMFMISQSHHWATYSSGILGWSANDIDRYCAEFAREAMGCEPDLGMQASPSSDNAQTLQERSDTSIDIVGEEVARDANMDFELQQLQGMGCQCCVTGAGCSYMQEYGTPFCVYCHPSNAIPDGECACPCRACDTLPGEFSEESVEEDEFDLFGGGKNMKTPMKLSMKALGKRAGSFNRHVEAGASASSGKLVRGESKKSRQGRIFTKEKQGPKYTGKVMKKTKQLDRLAQVDRVSYRDLASLSSLDRIRVGVAFKYLPKLEGTRCPYKCGTKLKLSDRSSFQRADPKSTKKIGSVSIKRSTTCRYVCEDRTCEGMLHGIAVASNGSTGITLGGRGRAPAGEGLLSVWLATHKWAAHHPSLQDSVLIQGIAHDSMQLYLDETRSRMAAMNRVEQKAIKFTKGMLVEWDECGVRATRIQCSKPCTKCETCIGHRLRWNRWIIGVERGNRKNMVVHQLPFKESEGSGGGVPLSGPECDKFCRPHLGKGVINLTDGADAYEAFAQGEVVCSPNCSRKDCLARARRTGHEKCCGKRPRTGRARHQEHYSRLQLSHGVVTHNKEEWAIIKKGDVYDAHGTLRYD